MLGTNTVGTKRNTTAKAMRTASPAGAIHRSFILNSEDGRAPTSVDKHELDGYGRDGNYLSTRLITLVRFQFP
jgi:hypothetical protein